MPSDDWIDVGLSTRIRVGAPLETPTMPNGDRYPKVIRDQREEYGITTVDEARDFWVHTIETLAEHGHGPKAIFRDEQRRSVDVFANASRWIALCPECGGGMIAWEDNPDVCCTDCGRVYEANHATGPDRAEASRLLAPRPPADRSWHRHQGESLETLRCENVIFGWGNTTIADGLVTPDTIVLPDGVTSPQDYLDRLRTRDRKAS